MEELISLVFMIIPGWTPFTVMAEKFLMKTAGRVTYSMPKWKNPFCFPERFIGYRNMGHRQRKILT